MTFVQKFSVAVAIAFLLASPVRAEDAHHPQTTPETAQAPSQLPATQPQSAVQAPAQPGTKATGTGMMGMMGGMGQGSQPGMMGSGGMMPMMMGMMGQGGAGMGGPGGMGMGGGGMGPGSGMSGMGMMIDRVEGRIAFLKAELKITEAQGKVWNDFAQALRANAKKLGETRTAMMQQRMTGQAPGLAQSLDQQESLYSARLDGIRTMKIALANVYASLSDEQKKAADELFAPHVGVMSPTAE